MKYQVTYLYGGTVRVDAANEEHAEEIVEAMSDLELLAGTNLEITDLVIVEK